MAIDNVGSIEYDARIDTGQFKKDAVGLEASVHALGSKLSNISSSVVGFGSSIREAGSHVSDFGSNVTRKALPATLAIGVGFGLLSKMAWDQVSAVQQATIGLRAYEKNGAAVDSVLKGLLAYARSDLGVLFNRKDLFAAAQGLKIMGDNTSQLTEHVKIMSRSVGLGLSTWDDLTRIIGRIGSTGRLAGEDFDNLTKAGFKLDGSLRNTDITFDKLFKALDKGIPADAMAGQADTIVGIGVRIQTAFRGIGEAILGVDRDTGQFVKGGAGDQLTQFFKALPALLAQPEIKASFANIGKELSNFVQQALPLVTKFVVFLGKNIGLITKITLGLLAFGIAMKILGSIMTAVGVAIQLIGLLLTPVGLIIVGIALAGLLLWKHWSKVDKVLRPLYPVFTSIADAFVRFYKSLGENTALQIFGQFLTQVLWPGLKAIAFALWQNLLPALKQFGEALLKLWNALNPGLINVLKILGVIIGVVLLAAIWAIITVLNIVIQVFSMVISVLSNVIGWIANLISWIGNLIGMFWNFAKGVNSVMESIRKGILGWASKIPGLLADAGRALIDSFIGGIKDRIGEVKKVLNWLTDNLKKWKGPMSLDQVILKKSGQAVIGGFIQGLESQYGNVRSSLSSLTGSIGAGSSVGVNAIGNIDSGPSSSSPAISVQVNMDGIMTRSRADMRSVAKDMIESVNEALRAKGAAEIGGGKI